MLTEPIHVVVAARPNYMKVKVLLELLPECVLIHAGQHYSDSMAVDFLRRLGLRQPDVIFAPDRSSQSALLGSLLVRFHEFWSEHRPGLVVVVGDVNATAAAALAASRLGLPVAHIEAGLRSRDLSMPEEVNRILVDACSSLLLCSEESGVANLRAEGRGEGLHHVGNTMIDCLVSLMPDIDRSTVLERFDVEPGEYAVCTFHRPANVDDPQHLAEILNRLDHLGVPMIYPVHPRVRIAGRFDRIVTSEPLFYTDFIKLVKESRFVVTDSGGLQEETTYLGVACLTYRTTTERPSTIEQGTNELLVDLGDLEPTLSKTITKTPAVPPLWDGQASQRISAILSAAGHERTPALPEPIGLPGS